jgi:adenylate kinase family enzyme
MINENENIIVIIGDPASGKSHLANELKSSHPDYRLISSDDYLKHGYQKALYVMMDDIALSDNKKMIIEGVQSARLLRKGIELNSFHPDVIIETEADDQTKMKRYASRGKEYPHSMTKNIRTVMDEYRKSLAQMPANHKMPRLVKHDTSNK